MNPLRRTLLGTFAGLIAGRPLVALSQSAAGLPSPETLNPDDVSPRHVLCILGDKPDLSALKAATQQAIASFATDFSVDDEFSQEEADDRMQRAFEVCWDRVDPDSHADSDIQAVAGHKSVLYVLGPSMQQDQAVDVSIQALRLIGQLIDAGAVAVKGESAGIAHGIKTWKNLIAAAEQAANSGDYLTKQRAARLALARRPLSQDGYLNSVGFHLVGLPDMFLPASSGDELQVVASIDRIADEVVQNGLATTIGKYGAQLAADEIYESDAFKHNPYGHLKLPK